MSLISIHALSKSYKRPKGASGFWSQVASIFSREYEIKQALDNVSIEIGEGELVGYIGPNGAGKSTTVKIASGILKPDRGTVSVFGRSPWENRNETVQQIGVVFGQRTQLWWDLQTRESFELLKAIYHIPSANYRQTLDSVIDALGLEPLLQIPVRLLSLGQRMRCELAASLLHSPKILFLDEPTIGLDAVSKLAIRDYIRHLNEQKKVTILLTTHDMDDIEALCRRVLVLDAGKICFDGSLNALRQKILPERRLVIDLLHESDTIEEPHLHLIRREGHRVIFSFDPRLISAHALIANIAQKYAIADLFVENPPIEELIATLYRGHS